MDSTPLLRQKVFNIEHLRSRAARYSQSRKQPGIVLINDTRTQNNQGCRATTSALLAALTGRGIAVGHTITLTEISSWGTEFITGNQTLPAQLLNSVLGLMSEAPSFAPTAEILARADGIVVNGEGSFYDVMPKGLMTAALTVYCKRVLGKTTALVNHSAELSRPLMRRFVVEAMQCADVVAFREPWSMRRLPQALPGAVPILAADMAFNTARNELPLRIAVSPEPLHPNIFTAGKFAVGCVLIGGSSGLFRPDRPEFQQFATLQSLIAELLQRGYPVGLLAADVADERMLNALAVQFDLPLLPAATRQEDVLRVLSAALCYVSGRWHASILAACMGTPPVLGDANFFKTEALHEMLALPWPMFSYHALDEHLPRLLETIAEIHSRGDTLRADVRASAVRWAATTELWLEAFDYRPF